MESVTRAVRTIVVPLDGSSLAERALPIAESIAKTSGARVVLLRVHEPPRLAMAYAHDWDAEVRRRESAYLREVAAKLERNRANQLERLLLDGHPADAICTFAAQRESPLVVMSSHGRTGVSRFWLGSVADAVIGRSHAPVLMVRASSDRPAPAANEITRVLVALDGSTISEEILPEAAAIAEALGARLELFRAVDRQDIPRTSPSLMEDSRGAAVRQAAFDLQAIAHRIDAEHPALAVDLSVRIAESPANAVIDAALAHGCRMVALTTRSEGVHRALMGSVANKVVRAGPELILLVRPRETAISNGQRASAARFASRNETASAKP